MAWKKGRQVRLEFRIGTQILTISLLLRLFFHITCIGTFTSLDTQGPVWVQLLLIRTPGAVNSSQHPCKWGFCIHPSAWLWAHKMAAALPQGWSRRDGWAEAPVIPVAWYWGHILSESGGGFFSFCPRSSPQSEVCRQVLYLLLDQQVQLEEPISFRGCFFLQESIFSSGFYLLHSVGTAVPPQNVKEVPVAVLEMCLPILCTVYITVKAFLVTSTSFAVRAIVWYFPYPVLKLLLIMQGIFKLFGDACIPDIYSVASSMTWQTADCYLIYHFALTEFTGAI